MSRAPAAKSSPAARKPSARADGIARDSDAKKASKKNVKADKNAPLPAEQPRWTFLTNHAHVLILLHADPDTVLREVAARVGITERAVQRILVELEQAGVVERERVGRRNHYRIAMDTALRHPIEAHCKIADLLNLIVGDQRSTNT